MENSFHLKISLTLHIFLNQKTVEGGLLKRRVKTQIRVLQHVRFQKNGEAKI